MPARELNAPLFLFYFSSLSLPKHLPMFALLDSEKLGSLHMPGASSSSTGTSGNASLQLSFVIVAVRRPFLM